MKLKIELRVHQRVVPAAEAARVAAWLVDGSAWFACTPLPEDVFEFAVKADRGPLLDEAVDACPSR